MVYGADSSKCQMKYILSHCLCSISFRQSIIQFKCSDMPLLRIQICIMWMCAYVCVLLFGNVIIESWFEKQYFGCWKLESIQKWMLHFHWIWKFRSICMMIWIEYIIQHILLHMSNVQYVIRINVRPCIMYIVCEMLISSNCSKYTALRYTIPMTFK